MHPSPNHGSQQSRQHLQGLYDSTKQFSNPICQQTFVSLPKIYGLKRGSRKTHDRRINNQRLFRPCCEHHEQQPPKPSIQELINKHLKPVLKKASLVNVPSKSSLTPVDRRLTTPTSKGPSLSYASTKRNVLTQQSVASLRGKQSVDEGSVTPSNKIRISKYRRPSHLPPIKTELQSSHKVLRKPRTVININSESQSQVQIALRNRQEVDNKVSIEPKTSIDEQTQSEKSMILESSRVNRRHNQSLKTQKIGIEEEDEDEYAQQPTPQKRISKKHVAIQMTETKEVGVQIQNERLNRTEISHSPDASTHFVQLLKKEPFQKLRHSRSKSLKSSTASERFALPSKSEIPSFILNYEHLDADFMLTDVAKSPQFAIVPYKNGLYVGEVVNGKRHGKGVLLSQKILFQGQFREGAKFEGAQLNLDGLYKGTFVNGLREGHGQFRWHNQETYVGGWQAGQKHGVGTWKSPNGDYYNGEWQHNRQEGNGIHMHQGSVYKGQFKNFLKHGTGEERFSNGDVYIGQYADGRCSGNGQYRWKNGTVYKGQFKDGMKHGQGVLYDEQAIYEAQQAGIFQQDQKHGYGLIIYKDGSKLRGVFRNNECIHGELTNLSGDSVPFIR